MKLARLNTAQDFKVLENPTKKSKYSGMKWTIDNPLILKLQNADIVVAKKWFINGSNELIYSNKNDFFNLEMYDGSDQPESFVEDAYKIVDDCGDEEDKDEI